MAILKRLLRALPLLAASPFLIAAAVVAMAVADLAFALSGRKRRPSDSLPAASAASVVIPNWNGRDLLEKYLPSVVAALAGNPENEIIVVDNASTDGSADFIRERYPEVKLLALESNRGFGGGSNAGAEAARNDIIVLLNSDMRVTPDFLAPLLAGFTDEKVFAVSCQIFFTDAGRVREETGLTQGWWEHGGLKVRHRADPGVTGLFPCFYGGGGSCAFDRRKFLELGGFDELLAPFYLEDADLGYLAWKRGWKVLYQPGSVVYHEHRGTIGKRFTEEQIQAVLKKNYLLFAWKNIHDWRRLGPHFAWTLAGVVFSAVFGDALGRPNAAGLWRASKQIPAAMRSRLRARRLAIISDEEAFRRPLGGYFRDAFAVMPARPERLSVLFVSPYPIYPPVHGGGVFMYQTVRELARLCDLHLIALLDYTHELEPHQPLRGLCRSAEFIVRMEGRQKALGSIEPHAVREFRNPDLHWLIHRQILNHAVDVLQLEYTVMAQYAGEFQRIPSIVFEHDIYFQSIARGLPFLRRFSKRAEAIWEYLRALRYELKQLPRADRIQVCSRENREVLESYLPSLEGRIDDSLRAGIDTSRYDFRADGREPDTMLFLGSFRHLPNQEALRWLIEYVLPRVSAARPAARLIVAGSDPPPNYSLPEPARSSVELAGFVEDVREPLSRYALFLCPILSGSGVRVKLLEAFAAGIPVVSTRLGAEGLTSTDGEVCALADDPQEFAAKVVDLLEHPEAGARMAARARAYVERERDMVTITRRLVENYRDTVSAMRAPQPSESMKTACAAPISPSDPSSTGA
jgi:GT2 family glycosyltransferase/glycosyltransferase involved in cell wall biosynthesis